MASFKSAIGSPQFISLDDVCNLIQTFSSKDDLGQAILAEKSYMVFCSKLSITRAEFNSAGSAGHKPDMMLIVDADSYDKEKYLEYQAKKYSIYKTFGRKDGFIELYCEEKQGD
jgi:SPP1 family predicted phage head-tail adaptor